MFATINPPTVVVGLDVETKALVPNSYILSVGLAAYDIKTLRCVEFAEFVFDPNDPEQITRAIDKNTIEWWHNHQDNNPRYPTKAVFEHTWGGTLPFSTGMSKLASILRPYSKRDDVVMPMRGPDFDMPILINALQETGNRKGALYARNLDSHRTVEKVIASLELPALTEKEVIANIGEIKLHTAGFDAAVEAYDTARMYHGLHLIKELGYEKTYAYFESLASGDSISFPNTK
jgi:hypothetical protein